MYFNDFLFVFFINGFLFLHFLKNNIIPNLIINIRLKLRKFLINVITNAVIIYINLYKYLEELIPQWIVRKAVGEDSPIFKKYLEFEIKDFEEKN